MTSRDRRINLSGWAFTHWRHPEWWSLLLSAGAWVSILAADASPGGHASHATNSHGGTLPFGSLFEWLKMVAAMMFLLLIGQVRFVASASFWRRRNRAVALFLAGYCGLWLVYGFTVQIVLSLFQLRSRPLMLICFLLAAAWQWTPSKKAGLIGCHRTTPLEPSGLRADFACFRYGLTIGGNCWLSCWALMLACAAAGHSPWAMVATTAVVCAERTWPHEAWAVALRTVGRRIWAKPAACDDRTLADRITV